MHRDAAAGAPSVEFCQRGEVGHCSRQHVVPEVSAEQKSDARAHQASHKPCATAAAHEFVAQLCSNGEQRDAQADEVRERGEAARE